MLVNPYKQKVAVFDGTRLLLDTCGIVGAGVRDVANPRRLWTIQSLYAPIEGRALGGIRARLVDEADVSTFVNQRDLEVLLGLAKPGELCRWSGRRYVGPREEEWVGLGADDDDLLDDLLEREMLLRGKHPGILPYGFELTRKYYVRAGVEAEELLTFLWDMDPETGFGPDTRLATIKSRWARIEVRRLEWRSNI